MAKAEAGNANSEVELGLRYDKGEGLFGAYTWELMAAGQMAEGQNLARNFKPR